MITSGLEDYLELIYNSISEDKDIKAIDIANAFNVSRSSVSEALIRLADMDLIVYEGRKGIIFIADFCAIRCVCRERRCAVVLSNICRP